MKSAPLKVSRQAQMRVVNNKKSIRKKEASKKVNRIYINTLMPKFKYSNDKGENIYPQNCALL